MGTVALNDKSGKKYTDWIHFEIRKSIVHDGAQREFVEIFDIIEPSDFQRELDKLKSIDPSTLKVIIITNIGNPTDERR